MKDESIAAEVRAELNLAVDENNLLEEWQGQAAMMLDYSIRLADAMEEEDAAKARLAVVVAELDQDLRENPEDYGYTKVTETVVTNAIPGQAEHKVATKALAKARHARRVLQAAVDALDHRKRTLQGMTELFMRQWYADPKSPAQPAEVREAAGGGAQKIPGRRRRRPEK